MDPEIQRQFEEFDERLQAAEKRLLAVGNLVRKAGIPMLVDTQITLDALKESDARLYGGMERLREAQEKNDQQIGRMSERIEELAEAQQKTEQHLDALIDSHTRLYGGLEELREAQKRTEGHLAELLSAQTKTVQQVGALARTVQELGEAQKRTDESLRRLIDRTGNGHGS